MPGSRTKPQNAVRSILDAGIRVRYPTSRDEYTYAIFPVIIPHIKHDNSRATAVVAILRLDRSIIL